MVMADAVAAADSLDGKRRQQPKPWVYRHSHRHATYFYVIIYNKTTDLLAHD
jgi:hypothetical protein